MGKVIKFKQENEDKRALEIFRAFKKIVDSSNHEGEG